MNKTVKTPAADYQHQRGEIKDNKLKAILQSPLFHCRVVKAKKGKGSYRRQERHNNRYKTGRCDENNALIVFGYVFG